MESTKEILTRAIKRIEDPKNWTHGAWARDAANRSVDSMSLRSCSWCAAGAIYLEADNIERAHAVFQMVNEANPDAEGGITYINDTYGHERVLTMLRRAM